jgi:hypothetical protein
MKRTCLQTITNIDEYSTCELHTTIKKQIIYVLKSEILFRFGLLTSILLEEIKYLDFNLYGAESPEFKNQYCTIEYGVFKFDR